MTVVKNKQKATAEKQIEHAETQITKAYPAIERHKLSNRRIGS